MRSLVTVECYYKELDIFAESGLFLDWNVALDFKKIFEDDENVK